MYIVPKDLDVPMLNLLDDIRDLYLYSIKWHWNISIINFKEIKLNRFWKDLVNIVKDLEEKTIFNLTSIYSGKRLRLKSFKIVLINVHLKAIQHTKIVNQ